MGKYLDIIQQVAEIQDRTLASHEMLAGEPKQPLAMPSLQVGARITWQGANITQRGPATVNFIHTDSGGSQWAFCTLPEGWCAVNLRFATMAKEDHG